MWLLSLWSNPLVRKFTVYAVIILGVLYCIRLYGNAQVSKGVQKGLAISAQMIEKAKKEEWKKVEASIKEYERSLAAERLNNDELVKQLSATRTEIKRSLATGLAGIKEEMEKTHEEVCAIPSSELDATIRKISNELRATK